MNGRGYSFFTLFARRCLQIGPPVQFSPSTLRGECWGREQRGSGTPAGVRFFRGGVTGGVAALNHRLMAAKPPACVTGRPVAAGGRRGREGKIEDGGGRSERMKHKCRRMKEWLKGERRARSDAPYLRAGVDRSYV